MLNHYKEEEHTVWKAVAQAQKRNVMLEWENTNVISYILCKQNKIIQANIGDKQFCF